CRNHHVISKRLGQFGLLRTVCSFFSVLNTDEAAHLPKHKQWNCKEPFAPSFHHVFPELCTEAEVVFDVVTHHGTLGKQHLLKRKISFPGMRILNEWMLRMRRNLLSIVNHQAQAQRIIVRVAQPEQYTARMQALTNCSKHFCNELFRRGFSSE